MTSSDRSGARRFRGRLFLLLGLGLAGLGVAGYVVQISLQRLMAPWYMPVLATLGVVLVMISLREKRTFWRVFALLGIGLLAAGEWGILFAFRLPAYTGPVTVGRPFPAFETSRADGTLFTQSNLTGDRNSVLVFFRGRW
jgi:FtsH-binding integral membrane protein